MVEKILFLISGLAVIVCVGPHTWVGLHWNGVFDYFDDGGGCLIDDFSL